MIEKNGTILNKNGTSTSGAHVQAVRSDRSSRFLEIFLVGYDVTGDKYWRDSYLEKSTDSKYGRIRSLPRSQGG
jgi:hypothetical protein